MCQLFGITAKNKFHTNNYLNNFFLNSDRHPHGWGIAYIKDSKFFIQKEPIKALKSTYLKELLLQPIITNTALAHIRYATIGNVDRKNCHPYEQRDSSGRNWVQIHNGTIFDYKPLNKLIKLQDGETDSERILLYIIERINLLQDELNRPLNFTERFSLLDEIVSDMSKGNKLNLIIYDGEYMYVHTNYINSLYYLEKDDAVIFSTEPLTDENWSPVKFTTLLAYKNGRFICTGTEHRNQYQDNEESLKFLYQIFSDL